MRRLEKWKEIAAQWNEKLNCCDCLLIGIGSEWEKGTCPDIHQAYESLYRLADGRDYFIVTTVTDGEILASQMSPARISAPCGNETWRQCSEACTKDIWEAGEVSDDICPHCGAPLVGNTIRAETYIEEGYLPQWNAYKEWLARTLNRRLLVLELGVDFRVPTVIRWPFEKTVFFNRKSHMYRINETFYQIPEDIRERAVVFQENSVQFVKNMSDFDCR